MCSLNFTTINLIVVEWFIKNTKIQLPGDYKGSQGITKDSWFHPLGTLKLQMTVQDFMAINLTSIVLEQKGGPSNTSKEMLRKMERGDARFCLRKSFPEPALIKMLERRREHNPEWQLTILTWRQSNNLNFSSAQGYIGIIQTNHLPYMNRLFLSCSISLFNKCNTEMKTYSKEAIFKHLQCYRVHCAFNLAWINVCADLFPLYSLCSCHSGDGGVAQMCRCKHGSN